MIFHIATDCTIFFSKNPCVVKKLLYICSVVRARKGFYCTTKAVVYRLFILPKLLPAYYRVEYICLEAPSMSRSSSSFRFRFLLL